MSICDMIICFYQELFSVYFVYIRKFLCYNILVMFCNEKFFYTV